MRLVGGIHRTGARRCLAAVGLAAILAFGGADSARADLTAAASVVPAPGLVALQLCVGNLGAEARVTTDYGCAELGAQTCAEAPGETPEDCLHRTRFGLAEEVARVVNDMPRRVPATLGMPQQEYRETRRSLRAAPDWPGCGRGAEAVLCEYRHVVEQWVEARELRRALDLANEGIGE